LAGEYSRQQRGTRGRTDLLDTTDAEWRPRWTKRSSGHSRIAVAVPYEAAWRRAIVLIASIWGRESGGRMTYNAVKAAEISLAKSRNSWRPEHPRQQRRTGSILPGGS
jgi:3-oxoacyl-[acyl-carrier protein] reductase